MSGLRVVVAVGSTLAETQAFAPGSTVADEERLRQFAVVIGRYPAMAAIYVGYEDGRFLYVGRTETLSISQRLEFDVPDAPSLLDTHGRGRRGHAPRDLVVRAGRRQPHAGPDAHGRLRPARAALVRRRDARQGRGADRALQLCPGQGRRRVGRHAAAAGRRDRLRFHAGYAVAPDRRLSLHAQLHHHGGERHRHRVHGIGSLPDRRRDMPAGRGRGARWQCAPPSPGLSAAASASSATSPWADATIDCWCTRCRRRSAAATWSPPPCRSSSCRSIRRPCWNGPRLPRQSPWPWPSSACCSPRRAVALDLAHRRQDRAHPRPRLLRPHAGREPHQRDRAAVRFGRAHARGPGSVRPLRVEEPRAPDHALARDRGRRRPAPRDHGDVHRHRRLLADQPRPWSRSC